MTQPLSEETVVREIKLELIPALEDRALWGKLTKLVTTQPPPDWLKTYFQDDYRQFFQLIVMVGLLRNELIDWCKDPTAKMP